MKKYFGLFLLMLLMVSGCGKYTVSDAISEFTKSVENSKSYKLSGTMEINNDEEIYTYSLESYYLKDDYYKVVLVNQTNNHEQIILKNEEGLYVVTPNLNKSFKFDSVWPENSSQAYLLGNILTDIKNDNEVTMEEKDDKYIIKSKVNYPNNEELQYQKIYFDKNMKIEKVEVYNAEDIVKIKVNFKEVNMKAKLKEDDFLLEDLIDEEENSNSTPDTQNNNNTDNNTDNNQTTTDSTKTNCTEETCKETNDCQGGNCEEEKTSVSLESIIYPLYIPANTHLSSSETVSTDDGERVILTFSGDKNFVIVEEAAQASNEFEVIPVFGDPLMLNDSIGALSSNSVNWQANNISYYLVGSDLSQSELVSIASSLGNATTVISTK